MRRLLVLVEGQTEEAFVRDVLTAHLATFEVYPTAVLLKTKRVKSGGAFRGGVTSTEQVLGDIRRLVGDSGAACVTTMLDYYAETLLADVFASAVASADALALLQKYEALPEEDRIVARKIMEVLVAAAWKTGPRKRREAPRRA